MSQTAEAPAVRERNKKGQFSDNETVKCPHCAHSCKQRRLQKHIDAVHPPSSK